MESDHIITYQEEGATHKVTFNFKTGTLTWDNDVKGKCLKTYIGSDGKYIQIMWDNKVPTLYHGK